MKERRRSWILLGSLSTLGLVAALRPGPAAVAPPYVVDGEWPPQADPYWDGASVQNNPGPTSPLFLDRFDFSLTFPPPFENVAHWLLHFHPKNGGGCSDGAYFPGYFTRITVGDVDNNGLADDVVLTMAGEAVFAAKLDFVNGQLQPLWLWLSPFAEASSFNDVAHANDNSHLTVNCFQHQPHNALIWNVDNESGNPNTDTTNEVVVVALDASAQERLYVIRNGDDFANASSPNLHSRLGVCKVRNTAFPRDIVTSEHDKGLMSIWSYVNGTGPGTGLVEKYTADPFSSNVAEAKNHEFNWLDIDGDGFDEFFYNGLIDFVNAGSNGEPVTTNPGDPFHGVARWQLVDGSDGHAHTNQCYAADYDPTRPGLEVYATPEKGTNNQWIEAGTGVPHTHEWDMLYDADTGQRLFEWTSAPGETGLGIFTGNWTSSLEGVELINTPRAFHPTSTLTDISAYVGSVRVTSDTTDDVQLLAVDGAMGDKPPVGTCFPNNVRLRSGGPYRNMFGIDWDGDYASDEILSNPYESIISLWRLLDKTGYGATRLPQMVDVLGGPPIPGEPCNGGVTDDGCGPPGFYYFYYQGSCGEHRGIDHDVGEWGWNNGGPGRGTHFFEKLGEHYPEAPANFTASGDVATVPYDVMGDHREEIVAVSVAGSQIGGVSSTGFVHVYFNSEALPPEVPARPSPHGSIAYRAYRQNGIRVPFDFRTQASAVKKFAARTAADHRRVVGLPFGGSAIQLEAFVKFSDGSEGVLTNGVTWLQDSDVTPYLTVNTTGLVSRTGTDTVVSGRFHARAVIDGKLTVSEPVYVWLTNRTEPTVLRAGFQDTFLVDDPSQDDRALRIEAYVAHKNNSGALKPIVLNEDGTTWQPNGSCISLTDTGNPADGDEVAGDGIFTAVVSPAPIGTLNAGDNFKMIVVYKVKIQDLGGCATGTVVSSPWPFLVVGSPTPPPPWPSSGSVPTYFPQFCTNPGIPGQCTDVEDYQAPRIRSLGFRGWGVSNEALLEAEVIPPPFHPRGTIVVKAFIPNGSGNGIVMTKVPGTNIYRLKGSTTTFGLTTGYYVTHVRAEVSDGATFRSDYYPRLRLHLAPPWDSDEPADGLEANSLEPSAW